MSSGFSSNPRKQTKASRQFGLRLRRMLINAAAGAAKNITPSREKAASNEAGSDGNTSASAFSNRTRSHPRGARRARAACRDGRSSPYVVAPRLTPATAYVQDALTGVRRQRRQTAPAKRNKLPLQ